MKVGDKVKFAWLGKPMIGIIVEEYKCEERDSVMVQIKGGIKYPISKDECSKI